MRLIGSFIQIPARCLRFLKRRYLDLSVRSKIFLLLIQVLFVLTVFMGATSYQRMHEETERMLARRLEHIARSGSLLLDGDRQRVVLNHLEKSQSGADQLSAFQKEKAALNRLHSQNSLETDAYTLAIPRGQSEYMVFVTMSGKESYAGNGLRLNPLVQDVFQTGKPAQSKIYYDEHGAWLSGFAPVFDSKGKVATVLEIDMRAEGELAHAIADLNRDLTFSAVSGLFLAGALGMLVGSTLTRPIRQLSQLFQQAAQGDLTGRAKLLSSDEIGLLAFGYNTMVEQLEHQRSSLSKYSQELEAKVRDRTVSLENAKQGIQSMINSLDQGFFMFDETGTCLELYSKACISLLGCAPTGKPLWEILRIEDPKASERLKTWVQLLFDPMTDFEDVAALGPKKLNDPSRREISLAFHPIRAPESDELKHIVVVATDLTEERDAKLRAEREAAYTQSILRIVRNRARFLEFLRDSKATFSRATEELDSSQVDIHRLFRLIHTFKSAASYFSLYDVTQIAHQLESGLAQKRDLANRGESSDLDTSVHFDLILLQEKLDEFVEMNRDVLGISANPTESWVEVQGRHLKEFEAHLKEIGAAPKTIRAYSEYFLFEPFGRIFEFFDHVVSLEALRQEKELLPIEFINGDLRIHREPYDPLIKSLIHIFRNAVAHGLETPRERREAGKHAAGQISVEFARVTASETAEASRSQITIRIRDDGRGISPQKIREQLQKKDFKGWENDSDADVIQRIFEPGFSTAQAVSELAGRGVGLDAVRDEVSALGGKVWVDSDPGKGTTFTIQFPEAA